MDELDTRVHPLVSQVRQYRLDAGLTQDEVGTALGRTQTAVSYWEGGRRPMPLDDLTAYAALFGLVLDLRPAVGPEQVTDEFDQMLRRLEAERMRPVPHAPLLPLMDLDEAAVERNRQELETAVADLEEEEVGA